jgi:uncharacterized membrane protein YraQ (UPF0718 family)
MYELADLASRVVGDVVGTFARVWPFLLISVLAAVFVSVYVGTERVSKLLNRRTVIATGGAVLFATLTPFCSWRCGPVRHPHAILLVWHDCCPVGDAGNSNTVGAARRVYGRVTSDQPF